MFILKNTLRLINIQCVKLKNNGEKKKIRQNNLNYIPKNIRTFRSKELQHINYIYLAPHFTNACAVVPLLADNGNDHS